jgi:hypothetical protein
MIIIGECGFELIVNGEMVIALTDSNVVCELSEMLIGENEE